MPCIGGIFNRAKRNTDHQATRRAADTGLIPHSARELMHLRIGPDDRVSHVSEAIRALVPPTLTRDQLVGKPICRVGPDRLRKAMRAALDRLRETGEPVQFGFPSIVTGKPRMALFVPLRQGSVSLKIFATAEEVADLVPEHRTAAGTEGG